MADINQIDDISQLKGIIEQTHNCSAVFIESILVMENFKGKTVWQGIVNIFNLRGHPQATKAYAWSSPIDGSKKRRFYSVLHIPPVDSPEKAVRASIVHDFKKANPT